jgi:hypothetical protein
MVDNVEVDIVYWAITFFGKCFEKNLKGQILVYLFQGKSYVLT